MVLGYTVNQSDCKALTVTKDHRWALSPVRDSAGIKNKLMHVMVYF
jgi:hypothetical protein